MPPPPSPFVQLGTVVQVTVIHRNCRWDPDHDDDDDNDYFDDNDDDNDQQNYHPFHTFRELQKHHDFVRNNNVVGERCSASAH